MSEPFDVEWIPSSANEKADYISRIVDFDDCMVDPMQLDALCMHGDHIPWIVLHHFIYTASQVFQPLLESGF